MNKTKFIEKLLPFIFTSNIAILKLLFEKDEYLSFDEIFSKSDYKFPDEGTLARCLQTLIRIGLVERLLKENSAYFKINLKGKEVFMLLNKLIEALNT